MRSYFFVLVATTSTMVVPSLQSLQPWHRTSGIHNPGRDVPPPSGIQNGTFTQLIDHSNPSLGTFEQRYWWDTQYWNGPDSPVVLFTPGEADASGYTHYCVNTTLNGLIAQTIGAATIVLEHRYWGQSSPFSELTTANLQYLNLQNSIKDLTNFANNVKPPFAAGIRSNADAVPWILIGGSYSGALTAYTESLAPGIFWASLATSAPVQAISDFWEYFHPIQQGMPQNCSKDVSRVIAYMDNILINGSSQQVYSLKAKFGLESVAHNDDFMSVLQNGPWLWQGNSFYENSGFFQWCDYVENAVNLTNSSSIPGPDGVGLHKALDGYAAWMKNVEIPGFCEGYGYFNGKMNTECFDTYNASSPMYMDTSLNNSINRQWTWMLCNQPLGFWQDGAPPGRPSIVSRLVTADYWIRQCELYFPPGPQGETYGIARGVTEDDVNAWTGGWDITNTTRMIYTNGQYDPWRPGSVSSDSRPDGPLMSTPQVPVYVIPDGVHCYDLIAKNGQANAGAKAVQDAEIKQISEWVAQHVPGNRREVEKKA